MAIYITGDSHGVLEKFSKAKKKFKFNNTPLTKEDYMIVVGDFGFIWDNVPSRQEAYNLNWIDKEFPCKLLFIHGNHENFPRLNTFPIETHFGGKVRRISENTYYLLNSQIFTIEGKTFFVLGGGISIDKLQRREGVSWWPEEIPSYTEIKQGFDVLAAAGNKVDYVLTHATHKEGYEYVFRGMSYKAHDPMHEPLEQLRQTVDYKLWFSGHYHHDIYEEHLKTRLIYHDFVRIGDDARSND